MLPYTPFRVYNTYLLTYRDSTNIIINVVNDSVDNFLNDNRTHFKGRFSIASLDRVLVDIQRKLHTLNVDYISLNQRSNRKVVFTYVNKKVDLSVYQNYILDKSKQNDWIIAINSELDIMSFKQSFVYSMFLTIQNLVKEKQFDLVPDNTYVIVYNSSESRLIPLAIDKQYDVSKVYAALNKFWNTHPKNDQHKQSVIQDITQKLEVTTKDKVVAQASSKLLSVTNEVPTTLNNNTIRNSVIKSLDKVIAPEAKSNVRYWHILTKEIADTIIEPKKVELPNIGFNNIVPKQLTKINDFEFSTIEYKHVDKYLTDFLQSFNETLGVKVLSLVRKPVRQRHELYPSDLERVTLIFSDKYDAKHKTVFLLPILHDDGTILLNGKKYVVSKQLFTLPITFIHKGEARFTSFVSSFIMSKLKTYTKIRIAGYTLPIGIFLVIAFGLDNAFKLYEVDYKVTTEKTNIPLSDQVYIKNNTENLSQIQKDLITDIARYRLDKKASKYEPLTPDWYNNLAIKVTGNIDALKHLRFTVKSLVDNYTRKLLAIKGFPTDVAHIIKFMHQKVSEGYVTDRNDLRELRLRSYEGIAHLMIDELRGAIIRYYRSREMRNNENAYIKVNERAVITNLISSGQVRLYENVNPMEEISQYNQITYSGYQGLSGENVPMAIRGVNPTYFGTIDPVATPEGGTIGVNQQLAIGNTISTTYGSLVPREVSNKLGAQTLSPITLATPFVSKNEPTRQIMVFNQAKSIVPLVNSDAPLVRTGIEHVIPAILRSDTFLIKSPCNGIVMSVQGNTVIIKCSNNTFRKLEGGIRKGVSGQFLSSLNVFTPVVKKGQRIKQGMPVFTSNVIKHDVMALGKNLVASYLFWKGRTFEDGVVISEDVTNEMRSWHYIENEVFVDIDSVIQELNIKKVYKAGDIILSASSSKLSQLLQDGVLNEDEIVTSFNNYKDIVPYKGEVVDCKIYVTNQAYEKFQEKLKSVSSCITKLEKIQYRGHSLNGILIKLGIKVEIGLGIGDKLTNRHAAKGVVTYVDSVDQMPKLDDGRHVQIAINPLSVINRTNTGQLYELYTGEVAYQLQKSTLKNSSNKEKTISFIEKVLSALDVSGYHKSLLIFLKRSSSTQWRQFLDYVRENGFPIFIPPFSEPNYKQLLSAMKILNIPARRMATFPDGSRKPIPVGILYIYKLEHMAFFKNNARSIGTYNLLTGQPSQGKKKQGGQRVGERDVWALASYGATDLIKEFFTIGSDDVIGKRQVYKSIVESGNASFKDVTSHVSRTKQYILSYLEAAMIEP